jgi:Domain of unknown function (DUF397)
MFRPQISRARKSRANVANGNCVYVGPCRSGGPWGIAVFDSKDSRGAVLQFTDDAWRRFTAAVKTIRDHGR